MADSLDWPDGLRPQRIRWALQTSTDLLVSPMGGPGQTWELPGARWTCSMSFTLLTPSRRRQLEGLLAALAGPAGRIAVPYLADYPVGGGAAGSPTITGELSAIEAAFTGMGGASPYLLAGDRFGVGERLHMVTETVTATSGTIKFRPGLRIGVSVGAILLAGATCRMRLASDDEAAIDVRSAGLASAEIAFVEALDNS